MFFFPDCMWYLWTLNISKVSARFSDVPSCFRTLTNRKTLISFWFTYLSMHCLWCICMWNWDTFSSNHQGGTQTCKPQVFWGDKVNTFNLLSNDILIWCRWRISLQSASHKLYLLLIIYTDLAVVLRWPSESRQLGETCQVKLNSLDATWVSLMLKKILFRIHFLFSKISV